MLKGLLTAARFLTGGKYHWRTIPTALVGWNLFKPRARMDPSYQQMMMYQQQMGGMPGMMPGANPAMMGRPY